MVLIFMSLIVEVGVSRHPVLVPVYWNFIPVGSILLRIYYKYITQVY
jgi:hypothetical protein